MDKKVIAERLRELASDGHIRSKTACLKGVIDDVEIALAAGVPQIVIVNELATQGLHMSLATFQTTLRRIRLLRRNTQSLRDTSPQTKWITSNQPGKQHEAVPILDLGAETSSFTESLQQTDLEKIIHSQPDLGALAKFAKRKK